MNKRSGRFLVDENLLGLLRRLRMMGIDAITMKGSDQQIFAEAERSARLVLTKDRQFSLRHQPEQVYFVTAESPKEQLIEVLSHFSLDCQMAPLSRCFQCNDKIQEVSKEKLRGRVDPKTYSLYGRFFECPSCHKIFWEGSHYEKMQKQIQDIKKDLEKLKVLKKSNYG